MDDVYLEGVEAIKGKRQLQGGYDSDSEDAYEEDDDEYRENSNGDADGERKSKRVKFEDESEEEDREQQHVGKYLPGRGVGSVGGVKIESFNFSGSESDAESGSGSGSGSGSDEESHHLLDVDELAMEKARQAELERKVKQDSNRVDPLANLSTVVLIQSVISCIEPAENGMEALQRLYQTQKKKTKMRGLTTADGGVDNQNQNQNQNQNHNDVAEISNSIARLTEWLNVLERFRGHVDSFRRSRESWCREIRGAKLGKIPEDSLWEYRYVEDGDDGDVHGPFEYSMMLEWLDGYFVESPVVIRPFASAESFQPLSPK
ncbi:hypothetical protein DAMA08_030660 [Martiniozyma asiatica (nom. inval.)]|nr:hypothetical protein DAMA08_030660 [Martiniozyma asiatica]